MCGIFGYIGNKNTAVEEVFSGLKELEYRGYDSWGIAAINTSGTLIVQKQVGKIGTAKLVKTPKSSLSIGHTRWATHGGVTAKNAHPHLSNDNSIAIVHNGIIENYDVLINRLKSKGYIFVSETDSELTAHYIQHFRKKNSFKNAVRKTFMLLEGLNALVAIDKSTNEIVAIKNGSPIVIGSAKNHQYLSSDPSVVAHKTNNIYYLEDNEMVVLTPNTITLFDASFGKVKNISYKEITISSKITDKAGYQHYLIKEIYEQPTIIQAIATDDTDQAKALANQIKQSYGTYLIGCGTAAYACMSGSYIFSAVASRHINTCVASEFGFQLEFLTKKSLVVALSQSGETADLIEALKKAKKKQSKVGGLVNVEESTIFRMSDVAYGLHAGIEKSVASTKAFTAMVSHLILAAYALNNNLNCGVSALKQASNSVKYLLMPKQQSLITKLAKTIKNSQNIFIVGRGLSYPASLESALKIKEVSYIHSEGLAAGELKHGVLALVTKKTPCIVFAPTDETYHENIAGAMEMKARGGFIIGVSEKPHKTFDYHIPVKQAGVATIIPNVVFAQSLAYYLTLELDLDPDMPRNLAKSVTVK